MSKFFLPLSHSSFYPPAPTLCNQNESLSALFPAGSCSPPVTFTFTFSHLAGLYSVICQSNWTTSSSSPCPNLSRASLLHAKTPVCMQNIYLNMLLCLIAEEHSMSCYCHGETFGIMCLYVINSQVWFASTEITCCDALLDRTNHWQGFMYTYGCYCGFYGMIILILMLI